MSDSEKKKNYKLIEILDEAEQLHANAQQQAHELSGQFQLNSDQARMMRELAKRFPFKSEDAERLTITWRRQNDATRAVSHELRETLQVYGLSANHTIYTTTSSVSEAFSITAIPLEPDALSYVQEVNKLVDRGHLLERLRAGLRRCGLDRGQAGKRSALDLIEDAERAISAPSGSQTSPTAALVPLREGIGTAIRNVFGRCRPQDEGKNWSAKVLSIGERCASGSVPPDHFKGLATRVEVMVNELSGGKHHIMNRDTVLLKYVEGLSFLLTFLDGVDESRLRN